MRDLCKVLLSKVGPRQIQPRGPLGAECMRPEAKGEAMLSCKLAGGEEVLAKCNLFASHP